MNTEGISEAEVRTVAAEEIEKTRGCGYDVLYSLII
jgi:hypothetical protein